MKVKERKKLDYVRGTMPQNRLVEVNEGEGGDEEVMLRQSFGSAKMSLSVWLESERFWLQYLLYRRVGSPKLRKRELVQIHLKKIFCRHKNKLPTGCPKWEESFSPLDWQKLFKMHSKWDSNPQPRDSKLECSR
tara:strand:- start:61 stop:462 length:402 start_codon:yes stop_codon:yes gene_type:complete